MDLTLQKLAEPIAAYVDFVLAFAASPRRALEPVAGSGRTSPVLLVDLALGVAVSWLVARAGIALGYRDDASTVGHLLGPLSLDALGAVAALAIVGGAALAHLGAAGVRAAFWPTRARRRRGGSGLRLPGAVADTINAAMGLGAFALPLVTALVLVLAARLAGASGTTGMTGADLAIVLAADAAFIAYGARALGATHRCGAWHALTAIAVGASALAAAVTLLYATLGRWRF